MDQQFDFEDADYQPTKNQKNNLKKINREADDFFDLDEPKENKRQSQSKFPLINNRRNVDSKSNDRNSKNTNPFAQNIKNRNNNEDDFEFEEQIANNPSEIKNSKHKDNKFEKKKGKEHEDENQENFQEDVRDSPVNKPLIQKQTAQHKEIQKQEENYYQEENFQNDNYENDFQQPETTIKQYQSKSKIDAKLKKVPYKLPPKIINRVDTNSRQKPGTGAKTHQSRSKHTDRSHSRQNSREILKQPQPNKYTTLMDKNFPKLDLTKQQPDKIIKTNQRIRMMIKKLNEQLNDIINRNLIQLKKNKNEKTITAEDRCKVLQEEKKNNDQMIERLEYELKKLEGKQGELKQEDNEVTKEQKIREIKEQLKQVQKDITKLQVEVNSEGKKLTKKDEDKKVSQDVMNVKNSILQLKRQEEKGNVTIQKLDEKYQELVKKITEVENSFKQKLQQAQTKGFNLTDKKQLLKRYEQSKKKLENSKNYRSKTSNLLNTKADLVIHQNQQVRASINNVINRIQIVEASIANSQKQSIKTVEKAKQNPNLNQTIALGLDQILRSLENFQTPSKTLQDLDLDPKVKNEKNNKSKNYQSTNKQKPDLMRNLSKSKNLKKQSPQEVNPTKPNLIKKINKVQSRQGNERVWKDNDEQNKSNKTEQNDKKTNKELNKQSTLVFEEKEKEEDNKKKPFSLKKNRLTNEKSEELLMPNKKQQIQKQQQKKVEEPGPSIVGPKMKFKRGRNSDTLQDQTKNQTPLKVIDGEKQKEKEKEKEQIKEEAPSFAPKRLNLRNRAEKKQQAYLPSYQNKKQEEYKPNLNFKQEGVSKRQQNQASLNLKSNNQYKPPGLNLDLEDKKQDNISSKPTFNLKLRDRKKNADNNDEVVEPLQKLKQGATIQKEEINDIPKFTIGKNKLKKSDQNDVSMPNENKKEQPKQQIINPYNPYANAGNASKKQRQGRIKKPKLQLGNEKNKFNIYDQAEDISGMNEFVVNKNLDSNEKITNPYKRNSNEEINDIIGDKKQKPMQGYEDLLGGVSLEKKKQRNKNSDFFGDIAI